MTEEQAPYAGLSDKQFIAKGRQRHEACFSVDSHGRPVTFLQGCVYAARHALPEALRRLAEASDAASDLSKAMAAAEEINERFRMRAVTAEAECNRLRTEAADKDIPMTDLVRAAEAMKEAGGE